MKVWRVEKLVDGRWEFVGAYNENFVEQIAAAVASLKAQGFEPYKTIRVVEVEGRPNG